MIEVRSQDQLYHQIMVYDHLILYARLIFIIINMKVVQNYLADRKLWNKKCHLDIVCRAIQSCCHTVIDLIRINSLLIGSFVFPINRSIGSPVIP